MNFVILLVVPGSRGVPYRTASRRSRGTSFDCDCAIEFIDFLRSLIRSRYTVYSYSVRCLERSELGGSHGCPGRLWDRFLWQNMEIIWNSNKKNPSKEKGLKNAMVCWHVSIPEPWTFSFCTNFRVLFGQITPLRCITTEKTTCYYQTQTNLTLPTTAGIFR